MFIHAFAYITDAARKQAEKGESLEGLNIDECFADESTDENTKSQEMKTRLKRTFTPSEVKTIVEKNKEVLIKYHRSEFTDYMHQNMQIMNTVEERINSSGMSDARPITIEEFDDKYQKQELVYGITKDSINKRITLIFRGSDPLAFVNNWRTNFKFMKTKVRVPTLLEGKIKEKNVSLHKGFYGKLFTSIFSSPASVLFEKKI